MPQSLNKQALPSLRLWIQSTALLTVVAGYVLLLAVNGALADLQRRHQHQRLVESVAREANVGPLDFVSLRRFGLDASFIPGGPVLTPRLEIGSTGAQWLVSRSPFQLASGETRWLELRQNVTSSLEQQRVTQLLLVAAAGVSILFTALLLRPVLRRGLVVPLKDLDQQLQSLEARNLGENLLDPAMQPQELRSIALAFNNLQLRLADAWTRERVFVDGVTHELRTPITVISGYAQRIQRQALSGSAERSAQMISSEAKRMADLLNVLRDLARSDAGTLLLQLEPLDIEDQLLMAYEQLWTVSKGRLQLPQPLSSPLPTLMADPQRLQQCLQELIGNALLYCSGSVRLKAEQDADLLVLHVLDEGVGIAESERSLVMQRFKRGSSSAGTRGTGNGLSLVDELMRAMGGKLVIADAFGGGADLQLRFKTAEAAP